LWGYDTQNSLANLVIPKHPDAQVSGCIVGIRNTDKRTVVVRMRLARGAGALVAITIAATGCTSMVSGAAVVPPGTDASADVALTTDGYGIQLGKSFAPTQIVLYTEPQCSHCAYLQEDFGEDMARYIDDGQLAVTYRFVTFLDTSTDGYSAQASNAFFLAANPEADIPAANIQNFVSELYMTMELFGVETAGDELVSIASGNGIPPKITNRMDSGDTGVDVKAMDKANEADLKKVRSGDVATPTVFDTSAKEVVDIQDETWLDRLVESS
jgi:hypothetical protein